MRRVLSLIALAALAGCQDIDRFDTGDDEAYCGSIVTAPFVFEGFPVDLRLRVRIDTSQLDSVPGTITTDDTDGACSPKPLFEEARLRVTPDVQRDQLSTLEFGEGRDMNLITWVRSSCRGPMVAVVSLMKNDDVELRILRPPPMQRLGQEEPSPGFALFQLKRKNGACGF